MEVLGALELPDGGDRTDTAGRESNAQDSDSLAWKFVGVQVVILATAVACSHGWNSAIWGYVCLLPSLFIGVVVWATTLDRRCSLWPLRLSILTAFATQVQGVYSSHYFFVVVPAASPDGYRPQVFNTLLYFGLLAPLVYKAVLTFRRCLQTQYTVDGAMLKASRDMTNQLLAAAPLLLVFTLAASTGLSGRAASIEEYAAHTPYCVHTPDDLGHYNTAFRCTQDPAFPSHAPGLENSDHIQGHLLSGIATPRLFLSPTTYFPFRNATADTATLANSPPVTNHTAVIMEHDYQRFLAVADYEANVSAFVVALAQGLVFIATLVASQVLVRGSRSTMDDLLQSRVTKAEIGAVACTGLNVLLVLVMGSLKGKQLEIGIFQMLFFAILGIILAQLACLYKICRDIAIGNHSFHSIRAPRLSAVVPQPPETAAGATGIAPTVEISPVISLPSSQDGVLAMMEGLKKELRKEVEEQVANMKEEQEVSLSKALEEQQKTANEQLRAANERAANLSKALEEQKIAAEERAANLKKAMDEELAGLRAALEEQRQKIEHLEAQHLSQTETRRVPL
jgi:hypothetical protein